MPALGDEFRAAREARHLKLSDVSEQIHIRSVYLASIEKEDWAQIAAPVYVRGFIRTYARFLGLDPDDAVERYNAQIGAEEPPVRKPRRVPELERRGPSPMLWIAGLVAVVLVAYAGWNYYQYRTEAPPAALASAEPAAQASGLENASPLPVAEHGVLELRITHDAWVRVEIDGVQQAEGIWPAGTVKTYHGSRADVRTGNAAGVDVVLNGKDLGTMGASGAVRERAFALMEAQKVE